MLKYFLIILISGFGLMASAQQGLQMDFGEIDSAELHVHRQLEYYQFIHGTFNDHLELQDFQLPKVKLLPDQPIYTIGIDLLSGTSYLGGYYGALAATTASFHNTEILSSAAYKLGNKLTVGGFSYGSNHIMAPPATQMQNSYFDTYGSTMFMKYKVSKNVSIEGSINVGQNRNHGPGF